MCDSMFPRSLLTTVAERPGSIHPPCAVQVDVSDLSKPIDEEAIKVGLG